MARIKTKRKTKALKDSTVIEAMPYEIYEVLMDSEKHTRLTHSEAQIEQEAGGKFFLFDGTIEGEVFDFTYGERIVLRWRSVEWPRDHYSLVILEFRRLDGGTEISLTHADIPSDDLKAIEEGWREHYWRPLKKRFSA